MALRTVLVFPDSRLRNIAEPVNSFDSTLEVLANDMAETMYAENGIGLAAIQINEKHRVITVDVSEDQSELMTFVNPEIIATDGEQICQEGCLSVPEIYADVTRAEKITVTAQDIKGESFTIEASGLLAVCIQHEIDHLDGKVFVDYLSPAKRQRIQKKMLKRK
ncbi:MAG: peptide deformylase [Arenicella sp.]